MITFHRNFKKAYKKLPSRIQRKMDERISVFSENAFHPTLNNHPLKGKYLGYRSINIDGDIRAVYKKLERDTVIFTSLGSHSDLYS